MARLTILDRFRAPASSCLRRKIRAGAGQYSPAHPVRHYSNPFSLVLLVVVITAVGTAGEAASREGWLPGVKTWLTIGVITAIVVYAAGMLRRSRAARDK